MPKAIVLHEYGGSDVLRLQAITLERPKAMEILVRQTAIGVHFHDIYVRSGLYKTLKLPGIPGLEAAGIVEAVGPGPSIFETGDRVIYVTSEYGAYASHRILPEKLAIKIPESVSDAAAAANFSRLLTVQMLMNNVTLLKPSYTILVTAASGGVGRLLCQYAKAVGARVIGTVGSAAKGDSAKSYGCDYTFTYNQSGFGRAVNDITAGRGVDIVYDSVGATTFDTSLSVLAPLGHLVNFGQSSGPVEPLAISRLAEKSLTLTRPILFHYVSNYDAYHSMAKSALECLRNGTFILPNLQCVPLADAAFAHDQMQLGQGGGSLYLSP